MVVRTNIDHATHAKRGVDSTRSVSRKKKMRRWRRRESGKLLS